MKVAGGVLGIIGGIINAIVGFIAMGLGAAGNVISTIDAGSTTSQQLANDSSTIGNAGTILLIASIAMFVAGILALAMKSSKIPGYIIIVSCVVSLIGAAFAGIIGLVLGIIGGILAILAPPKEAPAA